MNSPHLSPAPAAAGEDRAASIRRFNDALRQSFIGGRVMLTAGVAALPDGVRAEALAAVQAFDRFNAGNPTASTNSIMIRNGTETGPPTMTATGPVAPRTAGRTASDSAADHPPCSGP